MHDPLVVAFEIRRPWPAKGIRVGRRYWPAIITVWHREPGGRDSGEVCKQHWRLHAWHWKIQVRPLQALRRTLLTRCTWCGGRSRKGDYVNHSLSWDGPRGRWWQGEPDLFHQDCTAVYDAHRMCFCARPLLSNGEYGRCGKCLGYRSWREEPDRADEMLAALPTGSRIPAGIRAGLDAAWAERRARKEADA